MNKQSAQALGPPHQGALILYASLTVFDHRSTRARWRSTSLVLWVSSPASSHTERAFIDAKWSRSFLTVGVHQLPAIHTVVGDCSVKGGADRFISSMRSFLLHQSRQWSSERESAMDGSSKHLLSPIRPVRGPISLN
ncbi:hypothetical protein JCGZ_24299 [Jatropha curcas]|uniref:Uncharacterized protein n=1 Tax=Jatropha curcas TaxID=180498 RepID=A0A067JLP7_JATCU|nr:hypothetical protein JCGZ_24299 [Jatropha curcas]